MTTQIGANWAGTYDYTAARLESPTTVDELRAIMTTGDRMRALGTRHSFNDLADTSGTLVSLADFGDAPQLDAERMTVSVAPGIRYGDLANWLQARGFALHNMGSLPHISVAGAIATATHGSGNRNGNLSTAVSGLELMTGDGEVLTVDRAHPEFDGFVVALGALGIVTRVTLDIQPTFDVRQDVYTDLPWSSALREFEAITGSAYSVSLFTNWLGDTIEAMWLKTRMDGAEPTTMPPTLFGAVAASPGAQRSIADGGDNMTVFGGFPGPWSQRLPHFRLESTPSNGDEIQTEYFVDRARSSEALTAVRQLGEAIAPHLHITELRTVAADDLWLSPAYRRESLGIHFTWKNEPDAVRALLPRIQAVLAPFDARPHWGKWNSLEAPDVAALYPRAADFARLAEQLDPRHRFRNRHLARVLGL